MAAHAYDDEFDAYDDDDDDDNDNDNDNADEADDYDWGLFSSPAPLPPPPNDNNPTFKPSTVAHSSPRCSMDDDSSTEDEDEVLMPSSRHHVSTPPSFGRSSDQQPSDSPATSIQQRRAKIKELELKYQKECLMHCRNLISLQQQWRQELEDPIPGLMNDEYLMQEPLKQKGSTHSKSEMPRSRATSATTSNYKHLAASGMFP